MAETVFVFALLSLATAACSLTIAKSTITDGLRDWALRRVLPVGQLLSCPYCLSHWIAFILMLWAKPVLFNGFWINLCVGTFSLIGGSTIVVGIAVKLLLIDEKELRELREEVAGLESHIRSIAGAPE